MKLFLGICIFISVSSWIAAELIRRYEICKAMLQVDEYRRRTGIPVPERGLRWALFLAVYSLLS